MFQAVAAVDEICVKNGKSGRSYQLGMLIQRRFPRMTAKPLLGCVNLPFTGTAPYLNVSLVQRLAVGVS